MNAACEHICVNRHYAERHITLLDQSGNLEYSHQRFNINNLALLKANLTGLEYDRWVIDVRRGVSTQLLIDLLEVLQFIGMRHITLGGLA